MKTEWDYTSLADAYLRRPDYANAAIDAMRTNGIKRTEKLANVCWHEGTGEETGQASQTFDMVTCGGSFNVCDRQQALKETARILKPRGWFACMWNHRQLEDPIQSQIEDIIKDHVTGYSYGTRREDQTGIINTSGLFGSVVHLGSCILHKQTIGGCVEAWRSHATLERQAGSARCQILNRISLEFMIIVGRPVPRFCQLAGPESISSSCYTFLKSYSEDSFG